MEKGHMTFCSENRRYELHEGDAVFIPPYTVHNAVKGGNAPCTYSAVVFSAEWLWGNSTLAHNEYTHSIYANRYDCTVILHPEDNRNRLLLNNLGNLHRFMDATVNTYELYLRGLLMMCFQELYSYHFSTLTPDDKTTSAVREIRHTLEYIHNHFREDLSLQQLASVSGYSTSHFEHTFKHITGNSPFEYITRIRIINASEELKNTNKKITDIAAENGYDNISYFNRSFKKIMGLAPGAFRRSR